MMYLAPVLLIVGIWWLNVLELKKEHPQPNNLFFYKVISISFTVMLLFVFSISPHSAFDSLLSFFVGLIVIGVTVLICLPEEKWPEWYKNKLVLLHQYIDKKKEAGKQNTQDCKDDEK